MVPYRGKAISAPDPGPLSSVRALFWLRGTAGAAATSILAS